MSGESVPVTRPTVFTIGHSTRALDTFIQMLRVHGVTHLVDVRTIPRSRHNPQFNRDMTPCRKHFGSQESPIPTWSS